MEFEQAHQGFRQLSNTTAPQGRLPEPVQPPLPLQVLGEATGRRETADERTRQFSQARLPRPTNHYGCVTRHRSHVSGEPGGPKTPGLLGV